MVEAGSVIAVVGVFTVHAVVGNVDAIVLKVGDGKASGGKLGTVTVVFLGGDAWGVAQRIGDARHTAVVHLLASHHGHRLRRFANGQWQLGGGGGRARGVGTGAFSGQSQGLAGNGGGAQLQARRAAGHQCHAVAVDLERNAGALEHLGQGRGRLQRAGHGAGLDAGHLIRAVEDLQVGLHAQLGQRAGQRLHGNTHFYRCCVGHRAPQQRGGQQDAGQQRLVQ
ncbi:hypothetical protein D9M73_158200 [compost metagenome]